MNEQLGVDAIFCAAIEIESSDQRLSYLHQACGEDRELRRQVDRLLQAHFRGGRIVDSPAHAMGATIDQRPLEGPGTQVGPYKLLQEIGQGGMGVVYMAEQSKPVERRVALKIIKPGMDTRQVIARFEAERQALAMMDHPNIARVFDAGTTESGRPYFVMELVKGVPITNFCDEHRLTPKQRLELFVPVCQAVQHAHQKGVIHRDLKPSNVLVAEYDDKPVSKVIDFGVAKATEAKLTERTLFTELGQIVGTLEYMSPEQAKLNVLDIDTRSDIYALGVLLYELLTGTTPLEKNCFNRAAFDEMLRIIREEEPPKPSTRLSTAVELPSIAAKRGLEPKRLSALVRGELDWLVMKALEKDRNRRYDSANSLAQDIQRYLTDEPVQACPPSAWYRCRKFARRNKGPLGVAAGMFVLVVVIIGGIVGLAYNARLETAYQEEERHRKQAEHALAVADRAKQGEEGARKQAEQLLVVAETAKQGEQAARKKAEEALERADRFGYYHSIFLADLALRDDNLPLVQQQLETSPEALRGWEWHYLNAQSHSELFSLSGWGISFRADGTRIAMRGADGLIRVCDSNTGEELQAFQNTLGEGRPVFSPDGTRIAANYRQLRLFDALSGREMFAFGHPLGGVNPRAWPVFSPDGTRIATKFPGGVIRVFDAHSGQETLTFKASPLPFIPAFAPDGRSIAAQGEDRVIRLFDAQSGQATVTFQESEKFGSPSFNPDGTLVAAFGFFEFAAMVRLFDTHTGKPTLTLKGLRLSYEPSYATPVFSPDGARIAAGRLGGGIGVFDAESGEEILALKGPIELSKPVFSPDGKRIATEGSDGVIRVFDARSRTGILTLKVPAAVEPPFFSPDLTRIAAIGADGLIRLYETANGQESASLKAPVALNSLVFSPDGAQVAAWDADVPIQSFDFATGQPKTPPPPLRSDLTIRLFDARTGMETRSFTVAGYWLSPMFSPDGTQVAIGGTGPDIRVFDTRSGLEIVTFKGPSSLGPVELGAPVWSSDGTRIGACDLYGVTRVFDARKGGELFALKGRLPHARPVFSPDGTCILALGGDHRVRLFDTQSGQETLTLEQPTNYNPLVFSPDGSQMAASAGDGTLRLFDLRSGAQTHILNGTTTLSGPAFSPDGTRVVSVAVDGVLHLFDAQSGQETLTLKDSTKLSNAVFSPDGTRIVSAGEDHIIRIFAAPRDIRAWQAQRRKELAE